MSEVSARTLVVVGGWGVRCEMLSGLYDGWPGKTVLISLDDALMTACDSVADVADTLLARHPEPAVWLGWSLGAQVAMAAAARRSGAVTAVITVGGFPRFTAAGGWRSGMPAGDFKHFATGIARDPARQWSHFLWLLVNGDKGERRLRQQLRPWLEAGSPVSGANLDKGLEWLRLADQRALWTESTTPALHLLGERDAVVRPWAGWSGIAGRHQARVVSGMAHWPAGQAAERCRQMMAAFLEEAGGKV